MTRRRLTTAVTLVFLVGVLCAMAVWGLQAATAPFPRTKPSAASTTCPKQHQKLAKYLRRGEVTVSVFNAGKRTGTARDTMDQLERAGFRVGAVDNAPNGVKVSRAAVYTTNATDPAADLVAKVLGRGTQVVHTDEELGPGVDVIVGDKFKKLDPRAPQRIALPRPEVTCN